MLAELESPLLARMTTAEIHAVQRYVQLATTSIWVTNGDVLCGKEPEKSLIFGLTKSIMTEQPSFHLCSLDIDIGHGHVGCSDSVKLIVDTEVSFYKNPNGELDTELVQKDGLVYISRYVTDDAENANFGQYFAVKPTVSTLPQREDTFHSLKFEKVGKIESFYFKEQNLKSLGEDEMLIDVEAAPLDSLSIPALKGQNSSPYFGLEIMGTVCAVGSSTSKLSGGFKVCCLYPHHFDTAIIVKERYCQPVSAYERSADLISQIHPLVTSLHVAKLLRLQPGDHALVDCRQPHLAYMFSQVALLKGAGVHVTFNSDAGRSTLQGLGSKSQLVDRRTKLKQTLLETLFDVILTDSQDELQLFDGAIQSGGRILAVADQVPIEMTKAAVYFLKKGVIVGVFDPIDGVAKASTEHSSLLVEALELLRCNAISPCPSAQCDISLLPEAVSQVSQEDYVPRMVLTHTRNTQVPVHSTIKPLMFNPDASYLLIGCLGGLGRSLTAWMVSRGAHHFIFLSRSGADKAAAAALVEELHELGRSRHPDLTVQVIRGDISVRGDVERAISCAIKPIKGVVQAAMVLKDTLFTEMTLDHFNRVIHPKMLGTIHLHELLLDHDLDFFVTTSSVLGAIGAAMQSNYSAANAYLDHMARYRQSMGLQAMSIALGMIVDVGHVEEHPEVEKALKRNGLYGISVDEYLINMELACRRRDLRNFTNSSGPFRYDPCTSAHIVTGMDPTRLSRAGGKSLWLKDNRLRNIVAALGDVSGEDDHNAQQSTGATTFELLEAARAEGGQMAVKATTLGLIMLRFSKLVLLPVERIDPGKTLAHYGMDSMISAELKSWAWKEFKVGLPFLGLLDQGLTFDGLAEQVVGLLEPKTT